MTDHDRGAYAPPDDEPLSFDARRPSESRPVPMTLIGSAIVLVALIGGVALVYRGGVRHAGEGPRPVGEPVMSVKTAPPPSLRDDGGQGGLYAQARPQATTSQSTTTSTETLTTHGAPNPSTPNSGASGQAASAPAGPAPTFAAAPEQPGPRPAPQPHSLALLAKPPVTTVRKPATVVATPGSEAPDDTEVAAAGATRSTSGASTTRTASTPGSAPLKLAAAKPSRRPTRGATANDTADNLAMARLVTRSTSADVARSDAARLAPTANGAVVQIGAFSSADLAAKGYADVASDMSGHMSGKARHVLPLEVNGKTLYRTWVSGFSSRSDAVAFCETLRTKNKSCIVKG